MCIFFLTFLALVPFIMLQTLSQRAPLQSRRNPPQTQKWGTIEHHVMEEASYNTDEMSIDVVVAQATSLNPPPLPPVIHNDQRSYATPTFGRRRGTWPCGGHLVHRAPFAHDSPPPIT